MLAHHTENDGEAQTCSHTRRFRGEKGIEDTRLNRFRNARPVVFDFQEYAPVIDSSRAQANHAAAALLLQGVP
jgi:hypothetical protein